MENWEGRAKRAVVGILTEGYTADTVGSLEGGGGHDKGGGYGQHAVIVNATR